MNNPIRIVTLATSKEGQPIAHIGGVRLNSDQADSLESIIKNRLRLLYMQRELGESQDPLHLLTSDAEVSGELILQVDTDDQGNIMLSSDNEQVEISKHEWDFLLSQLTLGLITGVILEPSKLKDIIKLELARDRVNMRKLQI